MRAADVVSAVSAHLGRQLPPAKIGTKGRFGPLEIDLLRFASRLGNAFAARSEP
jgi:hypothetical protein